MYTIKDIAKATNVSPSTVSLVINNSNKVKIETRKKVWKAIKEYNYIPNQSARSLITKQKKIIGATSIINTRSKRTHTFDSIGDTYLFEMLPGIEEEINKTDYSLLLDAAYVSDNRLPAIINSNRVDGLLIAGGFVSDAFAAILKESNIPSVLIGARHNEFDYIDTDSEKGIYLAVRHLIENGHHDIVFINSSDKSQSYEQKRRGFETAMKEFNVPIRKDWVAVADFSGQAGYDVFSMLWAKGIRPTGVVTGYDGISLGVLRFLNEQGVRCPQDVSIVGFEDGLIAEYSVPPLTTIRVHKEKLGVKALQILFNNIEGSNSERVHTVIEPELIIRSSTRKI